MPSGRDILCEEGYTLCLVGESTTLPLHLTGDEMVHNVSRNQNTWIAILVMICKGPVILASQPYFC